MTCITNFVISTYVYMHIHTHTKHSNYSQESLPPSHLKQTQQSPDSCTWLYTEISTHISKMRKMNNSIHCTSNFTQIICVKTYNVPILVCVYISALHWLIHTSPFKPCVNEWRRQKVMTRPTEVEFSIIATSWRILKGTESVSWGLQLMEDRTLSWYWISPKETVEMLNC